MRRDDVATRAPVERHVLSLRVGQCTNIRPVTVNLLIAGGLIAIGPLLPRLIAWLPVFPYQELVVWILYSLIVGSPIAYALYCVLAVAAERIELSNQALRIRTGVFSQHHDHLALFRYRDHQVHRPLLYRFFRRGNVWIYAADRSNSRFLLAGVKHPVDVAETIHRLAAEARIEHGVHVVE